MSATYICSISFEVGIWNSYYQKLFEKLRYKVSDTVKTCAVSEYRSGNMVSAIQWYIKKKSVGVALK